MLSDDEVAAFDVVTVPDDSPVATLSSVTFTTLHIYTTSTMRTRWRPST